GRRRAGRDQGAQKLARSTRAGRSRARRDAPALLRDHRRRPGRDRARRAPEAPRRAHARDREERARRRLLAQALPLARAPRPGVVRPPAVPAFPRSLAGVLAERPDGRLAGDVRESDGAQLLELDALYWRALRRGSGRMGGVLQLRRRAYQALLGAARSCLPHVVLSVDAGTGVCRVVIRKGG